MFVRASIFQQENQQESFILPDLTYNLVTSSHHCEKLFGVVDAKDRLENKEAVFSNHMGLVVN